MRLELPCSRGVKGNPSAKMVKNPPVNAGDSSFILELRKSLEKKMTTHFNILA